MAEKVKLVALNCEQIAKAKRTNGERKQFTHAVVCGEYGQIFGTEKYCRKYFAAWSEIFPHLFSGGEEVENMEITNFENTSELVVILINAHDPLEKAAKQKGLNKAPPRSDRSTNKRSWISKIFGQ